MKYLGILSCIPVLIMAGCGDDPVVEPPAPEPIAVETVATALDVNANIRASLENLSSALRFVGTCQ